MELGPQETFLLYQSFFADTMRTLLRVPDCDVVGVLTGGPDPFVPPRDPLGINRFDRVLFLKQTGEEFGERLGSSIQRVLGRGYDRLVLVGADSPELCVFDLELAFALLDNHDVVLGPATDGGYYLIGMGHYHPELFKGVTWSTSVVLRQTISIGLRLGLKMCLCSPCEDIDTMADLRRLSARRRAAMEQGRRLMVHGRKPILTEVNCVGTTRLRATEESPCPATDAWLVRHFQRHARDPLLIEGEAEDEARPSDLDEHGG